MKETSKNIAILGAGIAGLSAALALGRAGHRLTIYDPLGFPAHNASAVAGGMLSPYAEIEHMPMEWVAAGLAGVNFWEEFSKEHNIGFKRNGSLLIAHTADQHVLKRFQAHLPRGHNWKTLNKNEIDILEPDLEGCFGTGIHLESEAFLIPQLTIEALSLELKKHSVIFDGLLQSPDKLKDVYDYVIDCRGMGAAEDEPELRGVKGELMIVHNPEFRLSRQIRIMHPRYPLYVVPRQNNRFMVGATMIETDGDTGLSVRSGLELLSALYSLHPSFGDARILETHAGIRPSYPDNLPRIIKKDNIIRCNGLFRHGYLLSPLMGECVNALINGEDHEYLPLLHKDRNENKNAHHDHAERSA